jgi:polysaccharide biosynthesis transport protein
MKESNSYIPGETYPSVGEGKGSRNQFENWIDLVYRRRWLVAVTFVIIGLAATFYALSQPSEYSASSVVMLELTRTANPAQQTGVGTGDNLFARSDRTLQGELFLIQSSHAIAQRVNRRLRDAVENQDTTVAGPRLSFPPQGGVSFGPATREANAIRITGRSPDPHEAALLANLYAEEYIRLTQDASRSYVAQSREFLEEIEQTRREELDQSEDRLRRYQSETGLARLDAGGGALVSQLSGMEAQRDNAMIDLQMREAELERIQSELNTISPRLADRIASGIDHRITTLQNRIGELEVQKQDVLLTYSGRPESELGHTQLPAINERLAQLRRELEQASEIYVDEVSAAGGIESGQRGLAVINDLRNRAVTQQIEISGLRARIDNMNSRIRQYEGQLSTLPDRSMQLARLDRDRQHKAQMHDFVIQRLQQVRVAEESEPGYAHLLREAGVPSLPDSTNAMRYILYGILFGLMAGVGLAVMRDKLDNRIYKPEQLKEGGYSLLGVVPNMRPLIKEDHGGAEFVEENGHRYSTALTTLLNPISSVSESYRNIRTNLQFSRVDAPVQIVMVTSAGIGEGKSTTAANMAVAMAQAGRRTLLIDCDLRRPQIHRIFGRKVFPGLVQLLYDDPEYAISQARTEIDNLYVIPAGDVRGTGVGGDGVAAEETTGDNPEGMVVANPAELLGSQRMQDLLLNLRHEFDVIVLDTPPVLAATDAAVLSGRADASIVVVRAGQCKEPELEHTMEQLGRVEGNVQGLVFNGFDVSMAYGYKYRYRDYTKYGQYSKYGYYGYQNGKTEKGPRGWVRSFREKVSA